MIINDVCWEDNTGFTVIASDHARYVFWMRPLPDDKPGVTVTRATSAPARFVDVGEFKVMSDEEATPMLVELVRRYAGVDYTHDADDEDKDA